MNWTLYVDESGSFREGHRPVVVAGVLISDELAAVESNQWRTTLVWAARGMQWPLHASLLNLPALVSVVIHDLLTHPHHRVGLWLPPTETIRRAAEHCVTALEAMAQEGRTDGRTARQALEQARSALANIPPREPQHESWRDLSLKLHRLDPATATAINRLHDLAQTAWGEVARCFEATGAHPPINGTPPLALVMASENWRGDDAGDATGGTRYSALLKCLLERLGDAVARLPGRHRVQLRVLRRSGPAPFGTAQLAALLPAIVRLHRWPNVELQLQPCVPYAGDLNVGYVFADFAANRACQVLDHPSWPLRTVEQNLKVQQLTAPVRSGHPKKEERVHLAATGDAQHFIRNTLNHNPPSPGQRLRQPRRQWVADQAAEWIGWQI